MGLKGISWFEQNVEKVVAGVFGVALLGVVALQFVGEGSTIELGTGKEKARYGYDRVWDRVAEQARSTKSLITSVEPDVSNIPEAPKVLSTFTAKLRGPVSPTQTSIAAAWDKPSLESRGLTKGSSDRPQKEETYAAVTVHAAGKPVAATYLATIHPEEVRANEDLAKLLLGKAIDPEDPSAFKPGEILPKLDRAAVSIETTFNGATLEAALLRDPDGDSGPASPLPRHWWDTENMQILGLEVERQELGANGEWGKETRVAHMPGRLNLLADVELAMQDGGSGFRDVMASAVRQREQVLRPSYYSIVLGEEWTPPSEVIEELASAAGAPVGGDRVARLTRQFQTKTDELAGLDRKVKAAEEEMGQPSGRPRTEPGPGRAPGGGGKGSGPSNPGGDRPETRDPKQAALERLRVAYSRKYAEREKIADELRRLGAEVPGEAVVVTKPDAAPKANVQEPPLLTNPEARLWTHDITVQRGKTYRYRVTVVMNNPIYAKNAALNPKQQDLAKEPLVRAAPTEWSDPVRVDPETFYFITSASPEDNFAASPRASAEVFVFSMGYWRKGQVNLEPGDTIAADIKVPDPEKIAAMLAADPNQQRLPQLPAPGRDGAPGRGNAPPGPHQERRRGEDHLPAPAPIPGNNNNGEPEAIDPATILVPRTVAEDAMLLDVASTTVVSEQGIAKTKTENQAFVLDEEGRIVVRTPDGDRSTSAYLRLLRSVERGEDALRPRAAQPFDAPRPTSLPNAPTPKGKPESDGGGGG